MKKLIASILASSMILGIFAGVAGAESRTSLINKELEKKDEIHILYNDKMVQYEDVKPINNEDRVMIPFRAALENMGASVEYDDNERLVTATKGDITIHFTLLDDIIYINNNGEESTITMDVPMIIVQDRTLVPIRFMSNALGMQVGWDGETQTVVIMDYTTYFDEFEKNISNLNKLNTLVKNSFNTKQFEATLSLDKSGEGGDDTSLLLNADGKTSIGDKSASIEGTLSISADKLNTEKTDSTVIFTDNNKLYLQSEIIKNMAEATDDNDILKAAESNTVWYSIDLKELFTKLGLKNNMLDLFSTVFLSNKNKSLTELINENISKEGEAVYSEAIKQALALDFFERFDNYVDVEQSNNGYTVNIKATPKVFADIISDILGITLSDYDKQQLRDYISYSFIVNIDSRKNIQTSDISLEITEPEENGKHIALTLKETATNDKASRVMTEPSESYDITNIVLNLIPHDEPK